MSGPHSSPRRVVRTSLVVMLLGWLTLVGGTTPVAAQLYGPVPANASGDPTYDFTDQDSIWTYVRSDIAGGRICIVPEAVTAETGSCNAAVSRTTRLVGIGTMYTLVSDHGLPAGSYRLLVENSAEEPTEVSEVFSIVVCPDCPRDPDAAVVAAFKAAAEAMSGPTGNMTGMCVLTNVLEVAGGKAIKARGIVEATESSAVSTIGGAALSFVVTSLGGGGAGFAIFNPSAVGIRKGLDIAKALACGARQMYADQAADPPDPDFGTVAQPVFRDFAELGPPELDAVTRSVDRQRALGVAMLHGYERYQGARDADNTEGQVLQLRAAGHLAHAQADELEVTAAALRTWADTASADEELSKVMLTPAERDELVAEYARVQAEGFSGSETDQFHGLGYTDDDIATIRAQFTADIASIPTDVTYSDALRDIAVGMEAQVQAYDDFGLELLVVAGRLDEAGANHAPTADPVAVTTDVGTPTTVTLSGTDSDGDALTFAVVDPPAHGEVTGTDATRTYTPGAGYLGTDTFTYTADDGQVASAPATVTITVEARPNEAPLAVDDQMSTSRGVAASANVLGNDSDADGDPLSVVANSEPAHGTLSCSADGWCQYSPEPGWFGEDSFTYTVSDDHGGTAAGNVSITVAENGAPSASPDSINVTGDEVGSVDVLDNDTDPDEDALVVTGQTQPEGGGVAACTPGGICTFTPHGFRGSTTFTYTASDGHGHTATAVVYAASAPLPPASIDSAGPLTHVGISEDLNCSTNHLLDSAGEWFSNTACGTFAVVDDTMFSPRLVPAGSPGTAWTPLEQSPVTGDGSVARPFAVTTRVRAGATGVTVNQTDTYVVGQESYRTAIEIHNDGPERVVRLYRAGDCFLNGSDSGAGEVDPSTGSVACVNPDTDRIEQFLPLSPGSHYFQDNYQAVWSAISNKAQFPDTCRCTELLDNGAGLQWDVTVPAGGSATRASLVTFSPTGVEPLLTTKTVDRDVAVSGGHVTYTIRVTNPGVAPAHLTQVVDDLPDGFAYSPGSSTGASTANPADDAGTLTWPVQMTLDGGAHTTLTFDARVASAPGTYANNATAVASDDFVVPTGDTAQVTVTSPVAEPNRPPRGVGDTLVLDQGTSGSVGVLGNDTDPDGDVLAVTSVAPPAHGTATCTSGGLCTYTPATAYSGPDSFIYTVSDGRGGTDQGTVSVTVTAVVPIGPVVTPENPDRDGDGLRNELEVRLGTDPDNPDTDADQLSDGVEVGGITVRERVEACGRKVTRSIRVSTSPLRADTDKDGLTDGLEVTGYVIKQRVVIDNAGHTYRIGLTRTDPTKKDTDRDRLSDLQEKTGSANKKWHSHKTDPTACDTDHGVLSDGIEVNHGSDPSDFRSGPGDPGTRPMNGPATSRLPVLRRNVLDASW